MIRPILGLLSIFVCVSCGSEQKGGDEAPVSGPGSERYGGVFKVNEIENFKDLYPLNITEVTSHRIASQIYEGLLELDQDSLTVQPSLAKDWEVSDSAKIFTFHLRDGVKFHEDECFDNGSNTREVTAHDFKYCFDKLCSSSPRNQSFWLFKNKVKGANKYHRSTEKGEPLEGGVPGIKVIDDHTLRIELNYPLPGFEKILAHPACFVWPKEALEHYEEEMRSNAVGTGPFKLKAVKEGNYVSLARNENYWDEDEHGNPLPYLDGIKVSFIKEKTSELTVFRNGDLDMVYKLPVESINDITGELNEAKQRRETEIPFKLQRSPSIAIQYYGFQHKSDLFSNKHLRKAFNYAIDREKITKFTLEGEGIPAHHGIIPPSFTYYPTKEVEGYSFNRNKAKEHLKKAGYESGEEVPTIELQLNSGGETNEEIAEVIQSMLKENLNVDIELNVLPFPQHLERMELGQSRFFRSGWLADYPDPENFLNLFYGRHVPDSMDQRSSINEVRYESAKFDSLFQEGLRTIDRKERMKLFKQADQLAMDDAVVLPLYYEENMRLIKPYVRNFPMNAMERRDFTRVYFDKKKS